MKFNINNYVKVRLTDRGKQALKDNHYKVFAGVLDRFPYREPVEDEDGMVKFQMWDLMQRLGPLCRLGSRCPFETEIELVTE